MTCTSGKKPYRDAGANVTEELAVDGQHNRSAVAVDTNKHTNKAQGRQNKAQPEASSRSGVGGAADDRRPRNGAAGGGGHRGHKRRGRVRELICSTQENNTQHEDKTKTAGAQCTHPFL